MWQTCEVRRDIFLWSGTGSIPLACGLSSVGGGDGVFIVCFDINAFVFFFPG